MSAVTCSIRDQRNWIKYCYTPKTNKMHILTNKSQIEDIAGGIKNKPNKL